MTQPANMIFLRSDNHNRAVTGCYGHPIVTTPDIDCTITAKAIDLLKRTTGLVDAALLASTNNLP